VIRCARTVADVARAWKAEARVPAARARLNAIAAHTSQALLAQNFPEGRCASGPAFRSAMTCSMMPERRVGDLGDLGVADPTLLVLIEDGVRVFDGGPRVRGDARDRLADRGILPRVIEKWV
jgi:hypothetical protein